MLGLTRYNLQLAARNIRRNPVLSALMVAAIGVGIGASMSMITVNYRFAGNPIPQKDDVLHYVRLDSWSAERPANNGQRPPNQLTYLDATAIFNAKRATRQVMMSRATVVVEPRDREERPFFASARATTSDFFAMFDVPFAYGGGWPAESDTSSEQVVVLTAATNERLFGGRDSTGEFVTLSANDYRVVGVLDEWDPVPKFYDVTSGPVGGVEDLFIPWSLIIAKELTRAGNIQCWKPIEGEGLQAFLNSECVWLQMWAELRSEGERAQFASFLDAYVNEQKALGRFPRPLDNRVTPVMDWLGELNLVPPEAEVLLGLSLLFLVVCLLNTIGLLLAKFLGRATEIGIRRALGASRRALFQQYLVEAGIIGFAGGVLGVGCTWLGLEGIERQFQDDQAARVLVMDWNMILLAVVLAIVASLVTALYPTWRACNIQPAAYLSAN